MSLKTDITKYVATQLGLPTDDRSIKKLKITLWKNIRDKELGGLTLTEAGFNALKDSDIKYYRIRLDEKPTERYTSRTILELDKFIPCPWYYNDKNDIFVFNELVAVQLALCSGNFIQFARMQSEIH